LIQPEGDQTYILPHLTFEEYLAACHLAGRGDLKLAYDQWCASGDRWREPLLLLMGRLRQQEKFDVILAWLTLLLAKKDPASQCQRDTLLAATCYEDLGRRRLLARYLPEPALLEIERQLRAALKAMLDHPVPEILLPQRIEAATTLGRLGDPRFPITIDDWRHELAGRTECFGAPVKYWCYVRPGTYCIGGWDKRAKTVNIDLPAFWIARFPVTVAQYAAFVEVGYRPDAKRWWTSNGWRWKGDRTEPYAWGHPSYDGFNQPVIGVTWYEATAFCAWLMEQIEGTLSTDYIIRLPTEIEWEAAAAFDVEMHRHGYPWGEDEPTPERVIYDASGLGRPIPVGCCPTGAAACGALDMAGNAWELTASSYRDYPARSNAEKDFTLNANDVPWRGGSCYDDGTSVRCRSRIRELPTGDRGCSGFRLVVAPRPRGG
jgi:formylglycine-generating enzyme required for sulfatase activity